LSELFLTSFGAPDLTVTVLGQEVTVDIAVPVIPAGTQSYEHEQTTPALVWTIQHRLGIKPAGVQCWDNSGEPIEGTVSYVNNDVALITFYVAIAGRAILS
jgi:hypothetical protein